jgi:hypothetical protein
LRRGCATPIVRQTFIDVRANDAITEISWVAGARVSTRPANHVCAGCVWTAAIVPRFACSIAEATIGRSAAITRSKSFTRLKTNLRALARTRTDAVLTQSWRADPAGLRLTHTRGEHAKDCHVKNPTDEGTGASID